MATAEAKTGASRRAPYELKSSLHRDGSRAARLQIETTRFGHSPVVLNGRCSFGPVPALFYALSPMRRFPNDRSGFCQICSWLNCSALCPNPLRAKMIPWKQTAHHSDSISPAHSKGMPSRAGAVINPTTKTRRHKEIDFLRALVSSSSLVSSCLVFLGRRPSKNR